ncbi:LysE/ArgO family amino acid transporter [Clostridium aminobutyricum]|uniref:LysE family transporter n=1 Tax=Clostridium aminobutyricum TaxID=33953 RepID=A0A939D7X5_CLOAM|nr:LysE family transporter [Clostridium aminobutyricum]MBN7772740.1 LysE family transporter [Clostridium aminobutyricum]
MIYYLQGLSMGLAYVAPIGLQNLFVINTALTQSKNRTLMTAFIVIFFDVSLALACYFGVGAVMEQSKRLEMLILLIGSILVIYIGIGLIRAKSTFGATANVNVPLYKVVSTACIVTWFNPQALIDGSMMLGAFKATLPNGQDGSFIFGVASASFIWFLGIALIISIFRAQITNRVLRMINLTCGIVIIFYGAKLACNFIGLLMG